GTVLNEGATKGILVTTADYGPDAYSFVQNKPLTLMNGANLLYLLEKHGHKSRIDLKEAKEVLKENNSASARLQRELQQQNIFSNTCKKLILVRLILVLLTLLTLIQLTMKKLITLFLIMGALTLSAQEQMVQSSLKGLISRNQEQIVSLANAFSEEQYDWRPAEGVRSVGEAILHTAQANYFLAGLLGFTAPEDVDMMGMEKIKGKENILAAFNKSFAFILEKIDEVKPEDFGKEVDLGGNKFNTLGTLMIILEHSGEHKGQLIAYARSNGVTPPWSN